ncbi:MAG: saccharopine dehydrogenase C-terminal domain-containing protein [Burkholderiales bacterium]
MTGCSTLARVLILGAGRIGETIAAMLGGGGYRVTIADRDPSRLAILARTDLATLTLDIQDRSALLAAMQGHDAVLNALPFSAAEQVAGVAVECGVHYFDLTEDVAATRAIRLLATNARSVLMPQCGLAPGFVGIVANDLARRFETLSDLRMRVGALPRYSRNALKYNLTWSTEGLINEYCNPCETIVDGERITVPALEGYETFALDGVTYEAFNTSGGLGTLCETLLGRIQHLDYKSIRYPGHRDIVKLLLDDLRLRDRRDLLKEIFETAIPSTQQDVVIVFVTAAGRQHGRFVQESFLTQVHGRPLNGAHYSAIQLTTAAGICAVLDLVRAGKLPQAGFVRQEEVHLQDLMASRFGTYFETQPHERGTAPESV